MASAYLRWKYPEDPLVAPSAAQDTVPESQPSSAIHSTLPTHPIQGDGTPLWQMPADTYRGIGADGSDSSIPHEVEIVVIDIYTLSTSVKVSCESNQTIASALSGIGFIGNAPFHPSVAVSMKTLELYRTLRRRKPSFSVEAFVKVICDLYMVRFLIDLSYLFSFSSSKDSISPKVSSSILGCIRCVLGSHRNRWQACKGGTGPGQP
jgi:hypothetical protein